MSLKAVFVVNQRADLMEAAFSLLVKNFEIGIIVILGAAYWHENRAHAATKKAERDRLIEELNFLNRVRNEGSNV